jgi:hypothetical protein
MAESGRGVAISLRKSPTLTPRLLAANRANARRSTGPRSAPGRARASLNSLRHGLSSRRLVDSVAAAGEQGAAEYVRLKEALGRALRPGPELMPELERVTRNVWVARQYWTAWLRAPDGLRSFIRATSGMLPRPWRLRFVRGKHKTAVTVSIRRGRGPNGALAVPGFAISWPGKEPAVTGWHVAVSVWTTARPYDGRS